MGRTAGSRSKTRICLTPKASSAKQGIRIIDAAAPIIRTGSGAEKSAKERLAKTGFLREPAGATFFHKHDTCHETNHPTRADIE